MRSQSSQLEITWERLRWARCSRPDLREAVIRHVPVERPLWNSSADGYAPKAAVCLSPQQSVEGGPFIGYSDRMKPSCPQCHGITEFSDAGGLFEVRCQHCDWSVQGTVSYTWPEIPRTERMPAMSAKAAPPVSAAALKSVRDLFVEARRLPLGVLAAQLSSTDGMLVGVLQAYRLSDVEARLSGTGVLLARVPHEEDER